MRDSVFFGPLGNFFEFFFDKLSFDVNVGKRISFTRLQHKNEIKIYFAPTHLDRQSTPCLLPRRRNRSRRLSHACLVPVVGQPNNQDHVAKVGAALDHGLLFLFLFYFILFGEFRVVSPASGTGPPRRASRAGGWCRRPGGGRGRPRPPRGRPGTGGASGA